MLEEASCLKAPGEGRLCDNQGKPRICSRKPCKVGFPHLDIRKALLYQLRQNHQDKRHARSNTFRIACKYLPNGLWLKRICLISLMDFAYSDYKPVVIEQQFEQLG